MNQKPSKDLSLRVDVELLNALNVFKWVISDKASFSTQVSKPVLQHSENETEFQYLLGFDDLSIKSGLVDLNDEVLSGIANVQLKIKVISINHEAGEVPSGKPHKGAPAAPAAPAEETYVEIFVSLHTLFLEKSGVVSISQSFEDLSPAGDIHAKGTFQISLILISFPAHINFFYSSISSYNSVVKLFCLHRVC